jgi:hypothetical protein
MSFLGGIRPGSRSSSKKFSEGKGFTSHPLRSTNTLDSQLSPPRSARGMAGVLDIERSRTRRERTFIGR